MRHLSSILLTFLVAGCFISPGYAQENVMITYGRRCASCHANDGSGKTAAAQKMTIPDLRAEKIQAMTDAQLFDSIGRGTNHKNYPHVFLSSMSDLQVRQLVSFIRTMKR